MKKINEYINQFFKNIAHIKLVKNNPKVITYGIIMISFFMIANMSFRNLRTGGNYLPYPIYDTGPYTTAAIILGIIIIILLIFSLLQKKYYKKLQFLFIILVITLFSKHIFHTFNPEYRFYDHPVSSQYTDETTGKINDVEQYTKLMLKYCKIDQYNECDKGKYADDFQSINDYIYVLNFANKNTDISLYRHTIGAAEINGKLKKLITTYNDDTFYSYIINKFWNNNALLKYTKSVYHSDKLNDIYIYIESKQYQIASRDYWKKLDREIEQRLKEIPNINFEVIRYY